MANIQQETIQSVQELVKQSPQDILAYTEKLWQTHDQSKRFNWWLGLAQSAVTRTFEQENEINHAWAKVAMTVYEKLAQLDRGVEQSLMNLKARLIVAKAYDLASLEDIANWFFATLPFTYDEVSAMLPIVLKETPIETVRKLREIKNRLSVLAVLKESFSSNQSIQDWLKIREQLP